MRVYDIRILKAHVKLHKIQIQTFKENLENKLME